MNLTTKIAVAAGALTLTAGGIAAAVTTPEAAEPGLTTAEEHVGVDLPVGPEAGETPEDEETEAGAPEGTHGAEVSAVAQSEFETGREHGEAVSTVAQDNHGAEVRADLEAAGDGEDQELPEAAADAADEHRP